MKYCGKISGHATSDQRGSTVTAWNKMGGLRVGQSAVLGGPPQAGVGLRLKSEVVLKLSGLRDLGGIPNDGESWSLEQGEIRGSTEGRQVWTREGLTLEESQTDIIEALILIRVSLYSDDLLRVFFSAS